MSKSNPKAKCLVCRLIHQMDEIRKHPNVAGLYGIENKLRQIREYTDMDKWCAEHMTNYRDVTYLVEHWAKKLTWQLENRPAAAISRRPNGYKVYALDIARSQQKL